MSLFGALRGRRAFRGAPFDGEILRLLGKGGANAQRSAELMHQLIGAWPEEGDIRREITRCEQEGDRITREIIHSLHRGRRVSIDWEDVYALASAVDDVVDYIEEAAERLALYRIEAPMQQAEQLTGVLRDSGQALARTLSSLERTESLREGFDELEWLEHEGDRIHREALAALFEGGIDPMLVIRWKDVFERLEEAVDACKHAGNILQGLAVKHG